MALRILRVIFRVTVKVIDRHIDEVIVAGHWKGRRITCDHFDGSWEQERVLYNLVNSLNLTLH